MKELSKPFQKDRNNLWYLDAKNVQVTPFKFKDINKSYEDRPSFLKIEGNDDYIIKDTTLYPFFFNRIRTLNNLKELHKKQDFIPNVDFPIGYYKEKGSVIGTIIPYYANSMSIREFIYLHQFDELGDYYYRDPNEIDNLICLLLDILELISKMYKENVIYLDIHSGNFLFYKNSIKVIDFEPGYVYYEKNSRHYEKIIRNYIMLVDKICKRLGFKGVFLSPGDTFMETEKNIKILGKRLERELWNSKGKNY